jgi:hypothetical protein
LPRSKVALECQKDMVMREAAFEGRLGAVSVQNGGVSIVIDALAAQLRFSNDTMPHVSPRSAAPPAIKAGSPPAGYNHQAAPVYGGERKSLVAVA